MSDSDWWERETVGSPWGAASGVLGLGRFFRIGVEGLSAAQAAQLGLPADGPGTGGALDLRVRVWRARESQRTGFVRASDPVPLRWESVEGELRIAERYFVAAVPPSPGPPREADLWTFWESEPQFPAAMSNFTRLVLSSGYAFPGTHLIHSSAFALGDGRAVLFFGASGAGKSTLGGIALGAGRTVLSDDLNLVEDREGEGTFVQPFPWSGDHGPRRWHDLPSYPLAGVVRLEKADRHEVLPLRPSLAAAGLAACSPFVNAEAGRYDRLLSSLEALVRRVPAFTLRFRKDPGFLDLVDEALR